MKAIVLALLAMITIMACNNDTRVAGAQETDSSGSVKNSDCSANANLELVFLDNTYQLTGVAKEEGGRLLVNYPGGVTFIDTPWLKQLVIPVDVPIQTILLTNGNLVNRV